jgi:hypothetical protein
MAPMAILPHKCCGKTRYSLNIMMVIIRLCVMHLFHLIQPCSITRKITNVFVLLLIFVNVFTKQISLFWHNGTENRHEYQAAKSLAGDGYFKIREGSIILEWADTTGPPLHEFSWPRVRYRNYITYWRTFNSGEFGEMEKFTIFLPPNIMVLQICNKFRDLLYTN